MGRKCLKTPDIWGGLECSFNRVDDLYIDQLQMCGHYERIEEDIDRMATVGIKAMRYPVIWERLQPRPQQTIDWSQTVTIPLECLRKHGIIPIAGLVHHGSGPGYAGLLSDHFAEDLSTFAGKVAEKFPWMEHYTPVNEPLTTARFSALYGLWHPHQNSDPAFARALVNEMKAVVLSMQAIRKINPSAKLVQTEDLAKVYSTPHLRYQADFENHRRWLTCDFLCGMLTREHPLWEYFVNAGIKEDELKFFVDNPCPPDLIGVDYYATSERYLDEALERYPPETHGGNLFERYADVEALRIKLEDPHGIKVLLRECWDRYHLPIAITEVHLNCDYDNQIRWFAEIRNTCITLIEEGVHIKAVTAWSLLGSFGWNRLLTIPDGEYESGVFDILSGVPVSTPMAEYLTRLAEDPRYIHPAELKKGWWHQEDRFLCSDTTEGALIIGDDDLEDCINR
jgi:dTDP-4-dehydrorhamnose reductase